MFDDGLQLNLFLSQKGIIVSAMQVHETSDSRIVVVVNVETGALKRCFDNCWTRQPSLNILQNTKDKLKLM